MSLEHFALNRRLGDQRQWRLVQPGPLCKHLSTLNTNVSFAIDLHIELEPPKDHRPQHVLNSPYLEEFSMKDLDARRKATGLTQRILGCYML